MRSRISPKKDSWNVYMMYAVQLICTIFFRFYLYNVQIKECTFVLFDKTILQVYQKRSPKYKNTRTNVFFTWFIYHIYQGFPRRNQESICTPSFLFRISFQAWNPRILQDYFSNNEEKNKQKNAFKFTNKLKVNKHKSEN